MVRQGETVRARVVDECGHLELLDDPVSSGLRPGDEVEVLPAPGARLRIHGLWKGTDTSPETIDEVRREMHRTLADGRA